MICEQPITQNKYNVLRERGGEKLNSENRTRSNRCSSADINELYNMIKKKKN